jgi:hypothetical protein
MVVAYLGGPLTHTQMNLDQDDSYNLYCAIISLNAAECVTWLQHACFKPNTEHLLLAAEEGCITASEVLILGGATPPPNGLWWMTLTQTRVLAALERVIRAVEAIPLLGFSPEIDEMIAAYTWTTRFELARKRLDCGNAESSRPFTRQFSVSTLQYTFFAAWWAVCSSANISPPSPRSAFSPAQRNAMGGWEMQPLRLAMYTLTAFLEWGISLCQTCSSHCFARQIHETGVFHSRHRVLAPKLP